MDTENVDCFRCYIEINQMIHRIVIRDIDGRDKYSKVSFGTILAKLRNIDGLEEVSLLTHKFLILNQRIRQLVPIKNRYLMIKNCDKIVVCCKTTTKPPANVSAESLLRNHENSGKTGENRSKTNTLSKNRSSDSRENKQTVKDNSFVLKIALIDTIDDIVKKDHRFSWKYVSDLMLEKGYNYMFCVESRKQFYSIIQMLIRRHRDNSFSENKANDQTLEIWRRIESMCLKKVLVSEVFQELEHLKNALAVKQTVNWLLIQTTMASMDTDYRIDSEGLSNDKKEPSKQPKRKLKNESGSRRPPKDDGLVFDRKLVEVIAELQINGRKFFDWPTVRKELIVDTVVPDFGEQDIKNRFQQMIIKYIWVLSNCDSYSDANRLWPLFRRFSGLELKAFCDHSIHQNIKLLEERFSASIDLISGQNSFRQNRKQNSYYFNKKKVTIVSKFK